MSGCDRHRWLRIHLLIMTRPYYCTVPSAMPATRWREPATRTGQQLVEPALGRSHTRGMTSRDTRRVNVAPCRSEIAGGNEDRGRGAPCDANAHTLLAGRIPAAELRASRDPVARTHTSRWGCSPLTRGASKPHRCPRRLDQQIPPELASRERKSSARRSDMPRDAAGLCTCPRDALCDAYVARGELG